MNVAGLRSVILASAAIAIAVPAVGQERPAFLPTRDVAVSYAVRDEQGRSSEVRVAWSASLSALRAESGPGGTPVLQGVPLPPGARVVLDLRAGRAFATEDRIGLVLDLPQLATQAQQVQRSLAGARVRRLGADRVAGVPCTTWRILSPAGSSVSQRRPVRACITGDGVLLRALQEGGAAHAEARLVDYAAQNTALFEPPRRGSGGAGDSLGRALGGLLGGSGQPGGMQDRLRGLLGPRP